MLIFENLLIYYYYAQKSDELILSWMKRIAFILSYPEQNFNKLHISFYPIKSLFRFKFPTAINTDMYNRMLEKNI